MNDTVKGSSKLPFFLLSAVLLCYLCQFCIINFCGFSRFCTPDMYEDTLIARLMWEQKTLFPSNYVFGNQFYVITTTVVSALFYGLTGSMNTAMAIATSVMGILCFLSMDYMISACNKSPLIRLCAAVMLAASVISTQAVTRKEGQIFFLMAGYYSCYVITLLFVLGDYVRSFSDGRIRLVPLAVSLALSFCCGMQSLRQTCIMILPLLAYECIRIVTVSVSEKRFTLRHNQGSLIRVLLYSAANFSGIVFMRFLNIPSHTIYTSDTLPEFSSSGVLRTIIDAARCVTGYDDVQTFGGLRTVIFCFYLFIMLCAAYFVVRNIIRRSCGTEHCWMVLSISVLAVIATSVLGLVYLRTRYIFCYYLILPVSLVIVLENTGNRVKKLIVYSFAAVALLNSWYSYYPNVVQSIENEKTDAQLVSDYLVENDYELVYGSFANCATTVAAASDGKLIAGCWYDIIFKKLDYLNIQDVYSEDDYKRAAFIILPGELEACYSEAAGNGTELTLLCKFGDYTVFCASQQMMYPRSG